MPVSIKKRYNPPTYKAKKKALIHGYIQYGRTKSGARNFIIYKTKKGWSVIKKR